MNKTKIHIDPRTRISYASYYIQGLYEIFGRRNITFSIRYFTTLKQFNGLDDFDQYFAFVVVENKKVKKRIVIDYRDKSTLNFNALEWCDIYGKVNLNSKTEEYKQLSPKLKNKLLAIGPNFGIRIWSSIETYYYLIINYIKGIGRHPVSFRTFFAGYNWQLKRLPSEEYKKSTPVKNYVFFISSLYNNSDEFRSSTNRFRAAFIRACKKLYFIDFEGGLLAKENHQQKMDFLDIAVNEYVPGNQFIEKIRNSSIVFNTPAVWGCHGWKLGEFLAMGKVIISTPLINEMPFDFQHGKHIHYVQNEGEIEGAIELLLSNSLYSQRLERESKAYFEKYLSPKKVIEYLIKG